MAQCSFRFSDEAMADLTKVAEHLSNIDGRAPNLTAALAWAIARTIDAIDKTEDLGKQIPERMQAQVETAADMLRRLSIAWSQATTTAVIAQRLIASTEADKDTQIADLRQRLSAAEAALERARATPYEPGSGAGSGSGLAGGGV